MADFHAAPKFGASLYLFPCTAPLVVPMPFPDESATTNPIGAVLSYSHLSVVKLRIVVSVGSLLSSDLCINSV